MEDFKEIAIIGMGLIGGSIAFGLKSSGYRGRIVGNDISEGSLKKAKEMGAIDFGTVDIREAVSNADLVVLAAPVGYYERIFKEIGPFLKENVVVTDVGSVKGYAVDLASKYLPKEVKFLGGHPMAGSEKAGIEAASPYLYENAYYFLTPDNKTSTDTIKKIKSFIEALGAYPVIIDPYEHDRVVAQISHIPHLTATMLVNMLDRNKETSYLPFVGGGFRDTTRIASGNPNMWKDILYLNKKEIINAIGTLEKMLKEFKNILDGENREEILEILENAKLIRDRIPKRLKDYLPPIYEIIVDVEDRSGILGELTNLIGQGGINIKEIEILHSREGEMGAIRVGFQSLEEQEKALDILRKNKFAITYRKG